MQKFMSQIFFKLFNNAHYVETAAKFIILLEKNIHTKKQIHNNLCRKIMKKGAIVNIVLQIFW